MRSTPILPLVDRVLYLVDGKFRIGTPEEVMTSEVLSELYRTDVEVLHVRGRLVVVGTGDRHRRARQRRRPAAPARASTTPRTTHEQQVTDAMSHLLDFSATADLLRYDFASRR